MSPKLWRVLTIAALTGPLPKLGVIAVAGLAAAVIVTREDRARAWAMLAALVLAPVLLLADIWHSPQLSVIHHHPLEAVVGAAVALVVLAAVAVVLGRHPRWLAVLAMIALPFRIPIQAGGASASNLLVPLYLVVAAGALGWLVPVLFGPAHRAQRARRDAVVHRRAKPHMFELLLAAYVVVYALQATYSVDFRTALQNMVFFYVPFALLLALLRDLKWDRQLVQRCLGVTAALAVVFALIAFYEEATKTLLLSSKLIATNQIHTYFIANSVFYDPDIFGRYLALVMILLVAVLLQLRRPREVWGVAGILAVLWGGMVLSLSRSSLVALLFGMATLAALRWRVRPVVSAVAVVIVIGAAAVAISPSTFGFNQGLNGASSGRANLVTGGLSMFGDRPVWGYGSGAFVTEYKRQNPRQAQLVSASHTIPVTVAAEQGLIGLVFYLALLIAALRTLLRGARGDPVRAAIGAAFLALLLHTMLYADFLEDPLTWTLLAIGGALATSWAEQLEVARRAARRARQGATAPA
jgi:putative inorganic carbon (hco3(-)) transporter